MACHGDVFINAAPSLVMAPSRLCNAATSQITAHSSAPTRRIQVEKLRFLIARFAKHGGIFTYRCNPRMTSWVFFGSVFQHHAEASTKNWCFIPATCRWSQLIRGPRLVFFSIHSRDEPPIIQLDGLSNWTIFLWFPSKSYKYYIYYICYK